LQEPFDDLTVRNFRSNFRFLQCLKVGIQNLHEPY